MVHVVAVLALALACAVWVVLQRSNPEPAAGKDCHGCSHDCDRPDETH